MKRREQQEAAVSPPGVSPGTPKPPRTTHKNPATPSSPANDAMEKDTSTDQQTVRPTEDLTEKAKHAGLMEMSQM